MTFFVAINFLAFILNSLFLYVDPVLYNSLQKANQIRPNTIIQHKVDNQDFLEEDKQIDGMSGAVVSFTTGHNVFMPKIINNTTIQDAKKAFNNLNLSYQNSHITDINDDGLKETIYQISADKWVFLGQKFLYCNENESNCNNISDFKLY